MEIDIKELFNNEQFVYALADSLAEKMFQNKVIQHSLNTERPTRCIK